MSARKHGFSRLSLVIVGSVLLSCITFYKAFKPNAYEIYINGSSVACAKNVTSIESLNSKLIKELQSRFKDINVKETIFASKVIAKDSAINSEESIRKNIMNSLNLKVKAVQFNLDGKKAAILANEQECKKALQLAALCYMKAAKTDNAVLKSFNNKLQCVAIEVPLKEVDTVEDAVQKLTSNKSSIQVKFTAVKKEIKEVDFGKEVRWTDELPLRTSKVIQQGRKGEKSTETEIQYTNKTLVTSKVIKERMIKKPQNIIVLMSSKTANPRDYAMAIPSRGSISSLYGQRWGRMHEGIDIAAQMGAPIYAAMDGKVIYAGWESGYGNVIKIKHTNKLITIYGHCSKLNVSEGNIIRKGQIIGRVGSTGRSTGPHLHFEVRIDGKAVNPYKYIYK